MNHLLFPGPDLNYFTSEHNLFNHNWVSYICLVLIYHFNPLHRIYLPLLCLEVRRWWSADVPLVLRIEDGLLMDDAHCGTAIHNVNVPAHYCNIMTYIKKEGAAAILKLRLGR